MRYAKIVDGKVENVIVATPDVIEQFDGDWVESETAGIGMVYRDGQFYLPAPESVSMRQARLALLGAGLLDTVDAAINQAGGAAKIEWEYATEVRRDAPLVTQMGQMLNMDAAALDALFVQAAGL